MIMISVHGIEGMGHNRYTYVFAAQYHPKIPAKLINAIISLIIQ